MSHINGSVLAQRATHGDIPAADRDGLVHQATPLQNGRTNPGVVTTLAYAVGALLFIYLSAVMTPSGQALDTEAMSAISSAVEATGWAHVLLGVISPLSLLLGTSLVAWWSHRRHGASAAASVCGVALGTALAAHVLKGVLVRPELLVDATSNSWPSGHVAAAAGLAVAAWTATDRAWRPFTATLGVVAVAATGLATITLAWHRPSDVVASVLIAVVAGAVASAFSPVGTTTAHGR